jgi:hypothetical protein
VTTVLAVLSAAAAMFAVYRLWAIAPPWRTVARSMLVSALVYTLAVLWPTSGFLLFVKLPVLGVVMLSAYLTLREFTSEELGLVRSLVQYKPAMVRHPREV